MTHRTRTHRPRTPAVTTAAGALSTAVLVACSAVGPTGAESVAAQSSAILGGAPDASYSGVGLVWGPEGCTGALIAPSMVLTAAHCVDVLSTSTGLPGPVLGSAVTFYTGEGLSAGFPGAYNPANDPSLTPHAVAQVMLDPNFTLNAQQMGCPNDQDVAILLLSDVVSDVGIYPLASPEPAVGTTGTAVGYGTEDNGLVGIRESATSVISSVTAGKFADGLTVSRGSGLGTKGDSGSPLFVNGAIAGIDMCHDPTIVPQMMEWYTRIDKVSAWVTSVANGYDPCTATRIPSTCGSLEGAFGAQVSCGICAAGDDCASTHCCPEGDVWSVEFQRCMFPCTSKHCPR